MSGGMATVAGGVLAAYVRFLGNGDPMLEIYYAKHLITASVLSAPAAIVVSKILVPDKERVQTELSIPKEKIGANFLEAISNGTADGLKLAVNVGAMLLVFTAMVTMVNFMLQNLVGEWTGLNSEIVALTQGSYQGLNLQFLLGYIGAPIAWMTGVPVEDMVSVGQLVGQKTVLNEFYAYVELAQMKNSGVFVHEKSVIMVTYILCGFSNFASIGIQIGGIGSLAPARRGQLSELGFRAMLAGSLACLMTAAVAGMYY
jgi:CNT family concentrative nucleoside transporter